jgi:glycerol uptake operon antiterminator
MPARSLIGKNSPVIYGVRDIADLPLALASTHDVIFLLTGNLLTLGDTVAHVRAHKKDVFVHLDMVEGLGKDVHGLRWLAQTVRPTGIITTRAASIGQAKTLGLATVQRMFLLDSQSLHTGLHQVNDAKPDYLEVMPGIVPETLREIVRRVPCPVIAGGLVKRQAEVQAALDSGAIAVSTSNKDLWQYRHTYEEVVGSSTRNSSNRTAQS